MEVNDGALEPIEGALGYSLGTLRPNEWNLEGTLRINEGRLWPLEGPTIGTVRPDIGSLGVNRGILGTTNGGLRSSGGTLRVSEEIRGHAEGTLGFYQGSLERIGGHSTAAVWSRGGTLGTDHRSLGYRVIEGGALGSSEGLLGLQKGTSVTIPPKGTRGALGSLRIHEGIVVPSAWTVSHHGGPLRRCKWASRRVMTREGTLGVIVGTLGPSVGTQRDKARTLEPGKVALRTGQWQRRGPPGTLGLGIGGRREDCSTGIRLVRHGEPVAGTIWQIKHRR